MNFSIAIMFLIGGLSQVHSNPVDSCFGVYPPPEECLDHDDNRRGLITHDSAHISERSLQTPDDNEYYVNAYDGSIGYIYLTSTSSLSLCPSKVTFDFSLDANLGVGGIHTIPRTLNLEVLNASNEVILTVPVPSATIPVGSDTFSTQVLEEEIVLMGPLFNYCTAGAKLRFAWHIPEMYTGPAQFVLDNVFVEKIKIYDDDDDDWRGGGKFEVAGDPIQDNFAPSHTIDCSVCGDFGPSYLGTSLDFGLGGFSVIGDPITPALLLSTPAPSKAPPSPAPSSIPSDVPSASAARTAFEKGTVVVPSDAPSPSAVPSDVPSCGCDSF